MKNLLFLILFIAGCKNTTETVTPKTSDIVESVYASGFVNSEDQYEVFTKVNGKIQTVFVKEDKLVKKGDPLFQIENLNSKISTDNALLSAQANDFKLNKENLTEAKKILDLAKKKLSNDSIMLVRQKALWNQNIGKKIDLEEKLLSYENAKVNLKQAEVSYQNLSRQLKLNSNQSKNNLRIAQSNENELIIRSEMDGYIYKINAKQGEFASSMAPLAVVGKENFIIELNVDEFDIVNIKVGQKVIVTMDSYKKQAFNAQISFIYPMMNERTRAFKVEAVFTTIPSVLFPNLTLEANIIISEKKNALTIPTSFLVNDSSVMLSDGTIKKIKIGLKDYTLTEIISGIDKNTKIIMPKK